MKVFRATTSNFSDLASLHNPSGNKGRWNEHSQNVLYTSDCLNNALSEYGYYKIIKDLKNLKAEYKSFSRVPPAANQICSGKNGVIVNFDINNVRVEDLLSNSNLQRFCLRAGIPNLTLSAYRSENFYHDSRRQDVIKTYISGNANVVLVLSARANYCNNVLLLTDKFNIGDFTNLNHQEFTVYPSYKKNRCTNLKKGFSLNEVSVQISGSNSILKVL